MITKRKFLNILCIVITLAIGVILSFWQTRPPRIDQSSPMYQVYLSMMANLHKMAVIPHPSGSAEIEAVRTHLLSEIKNMGLTPIIQETVYTLDEYIERNIYERNKRSSMEEHWEQVKENAQQEGIYSFEEFEKYLENSGLLSTIPDENYALDEIIENFYSKLNYDSLDDYWEIVKDILKQFDIFSFGEFNKYIGNYYGIEVDENGNQILQNIMVKLDSPDTDRGVLFMSHYDSNPMTIGAADAMLGVVSILEALRSQTQNNSLKNDLYFLFTDGEELGMLGVYNFIEEYPELKDKIDLVINFEARGNSGALILFETSPNAYNLVKTIKRTGVWLYGFSAGSFFYHISPYNSDLTVFLENGYNGLNFAAIEGVKAYHTMEDNYENLNRATAMHYLQTTLSLADYFANNVMDNLQKPSYKAIFFPFLPGNIMLMNNIVSSILCTIACILALTMIILNIKKKQLKIVFFNISIIFFIIASILCSIFLVTASYLLYLPLLLIAITSLMKKWYIVHLIAKMVSGIIILMLWIPVIFSLLLITVIPLIL